MNNNNLAEGNFSQFPLLSGEIKLLSEIGFMAASLGLTEQAKGIFTGLRIFRNKSTFIYIGMALSFMLVGKWNEAIYVLRDEGLKNIPDSHEIKLYLSLALIASDQPYIGEIILSQAVKNSSLSNEEMKFALSIKQKVLNRTSSISHSENKKIYY